jgi:hypothetical protein
MKTKDITTDIQSLINGHIPFLLSVGAVNKKYALIYDALRKLLNGNYEKYNFSINACVFIDTILSDEEFQNSLSCLNEKQEKRKVFGVYYTPRDVTSFIIHNCFFNRFDYEEKISLKTLSHKQTFDLSDSKFIKNLLNKNIFDPTCGAGEFLLGALQAKINILKNSTFSIKERNYINILKTIHGNDIDTESVEITKIRLFFETVKHINDAEDYSEIVEILNKNIHNEDFLNPKPNSFIKYDIIIGNPPYIEDNKFKKVIDIKYGNLYANVIHKSIDILKDDGILGFIIPISYVSTPRMKKIRQFMERKTKIQVVLNYADRPDALFVSVHQKVSILYAIKGKEKNKLYTSGYKYWYKSERNRLFEDNNVFNCDIIPDEFYPKIGSELEYNIFNKIYTDSPDNLYDLSIRNSDKSIYLNMRACYWIKAFTFNPGSNEYKAFGFKEDLYYFSMCLLNSSLFFWYWTVVSDCWHITAKELKHFYLPKSINKLNIYKKLSEKLEKKLEKTKHYIGTKQVEYEYKHRLCKDVIDQIDDNIAEVYKITSNEVNYIKNYAIKYREGRGF